MDYWYGMKLRRGCDVEMNDVLIVWNDGGERRM